MSPCPCGRTGPRVRCIGRTDDMLIVRGVNVFPSALREVVSEFEPAGQRPDPGQAGRCRASSRNRRFPSASSLRGATVDAALADAIRERLREVLVVPDTD